MRKIVVFDRVSADGYYSATDGNLNWAVPEPELDKGAAGSLDGAGTMLFGRRTYDMFESFWPNGAGRRRHARPTRTPPDGATRRCTRWRSGSTRPKRSCSRGRGSR